METEILCDLTLLPFPVTLAPAETDDGKGGNIKIVTKYI